MATPTVAAPSTMKSHLQPEIPWALWRVLIMAPATMLPNAPARMAALVKNMNLFACSAFLYQVEMRKTTAGWNESVSVVQTSARTSRCSIAR